MRLWRHGLHPRTPEKLHVYLTDIFDRHFRSQPTPSPALHDGSLTWDIIVAGSYENFCGHFTALTIPRGDGDRPDTLVVLWQALPTCPRRDRAHADLLDLIAVPPSLDEFTGVLHSKNGHSSGGPSGTGLRHGSRSICLSGVHVDPSTYPRILEIEMARAHPERTL